MAILRRSALLLLTLSFGQQCVADHFLTVHENVIGTTFELTVQATSEKVAQQAEDRALAEIQRLAKIFSSYDTQSEFSKFVSLPVGISTVLSVELRDALASSEFWRHVSHGAFNPAAEYLAEVRNHGTSDSVLDAVRNANQAHWRLGVGSPSVTRLSECRLSLNAIAKGIILDRVACVVSEVEGVAGVVVNIGGDVRVAGDAVGSVLIADPEDDTISGSPLQKIEVVDGAVATSGFSERPDHILDPRTGAPAKQSVSATVIAPTAETADALATICCVLSPTEALALINSLSGVDALLVSSTGNLLSSNNWPEAGGGRPDASVEESAAASAEAKKEKLTGHNVLVEFEISRPSNARRYRRPYVAVWVEDKDRFPVKTLSLFLMKDNPGPRWHRDLRRWYSGDQMRKLVDDKNLIETKSKPTRNPGDYKVSWDGRDDSGQLLKPGKYTLLIESAREHGSYQLIRHEFEFGKPELEKLKGNVEISAATFEYKVGE